MRILFVAPRYHTNQVEQIRALIAAGHEVWFHAATVGATENHRDVVPHLHSPSLITRWARKWWGPNANDLWYCPALVSYWRLMREIAPHLVVIRWHNPLFCRLAGLYARLNGFRTIVYEQFSADVLRKVWSDGLIGRLRRLRFRTRQWLLNAAWMTPLPGEAPLPSGCYFVPFAVPVNEDARPVSEIPRVLEVGKFLPRKNHLRFLAAIQELIADVPLTATIVGEASTPTQRELLEKVARAVEDAGLAGVVSICMNVAHDEMPEVYDQHSVFVLPAIAEPGAVSPLEAMGHGLPVVVTDSCGTKGYVREGLDGFVCASASTPALVDAIRKAVHLSRESGIRERVVAGAASRFSGDAFLAAFSAMVEEHFGMPLVSVTDRIGPMMIRN